tara:strand:+ start:832 stop:1992 length:1161 start_codon:yes stop_codon:yes gene_type:complete
VAQNQRPFVLDRRLLLGSGLALLASPAVARRQGVIEAPIEVGDHRVTIAAHLNGRGPYRFVIDTGAQLSGVSSGLARELGLRAARTVRLNGRQFDVYAIDELLLGGVVRQAEAAFFGLDDARTLGGEGLLAAGMVTTVDSELLHGEGLWRLHPSGLATMDGYDLVAARLDRARVSGLSARPHGPVRVRDTEIDAVWDTGGPHALSLPSGLAGRLGLTGPDTPFAPIPGASIRGRATVPARMIAAPPIRVGNETFDGGRIVIRMDDSLSDAVILGFPVLRGLDLAIAGRGQRFGIRRNALGPVNLPYGFSGLWLDDVRGRLTVSVVGTRSPAADAGLLEGDVITNLGDMSSAIRALRGPDGTSVTVTFVRNGETQSATIRLRDYLAA